MKKVLTLTVLLAASTAAQAEQPAVQRNVQRQSGVRLTTLVVRDLLAATVACPTNALLYTIEQIDGIAVKSENAQTWSQTGQAYAGQWQELRNNIDARARGSRCNAELNNVVESSKEVIERMPGTWQRIKETYNGTVERLRQ